MGICRTWRLEYPNYIYAGSDDPTQVAWFKEKYSNENTYVSNDIGTKKPNELGLYDMSGNIYEWCMDWYDKKFLSPEILILT